MICEHCGAKLIGVIEIAEHPCFKDEFKFNYLITADDIRKLRKYLRRYFNGKNF